MSEKDELLALARKYRALEALRIEYERTGRVAERDVLRALAAEFPGALRELDRLPLDEIEARARALEEAAHGGSVEPWMTWLSGYHALMRAALFIKARRANGEPVTDDLLALEASAHAGTSVNADFVRAIARPRGGRISHVVLDTLAERFGTRREVIEEAITAPSRSSLRAAHCR